MIHRGLVSCTSLLVLLTFGAALAHAQEPSPSSPTPEPAAEVPQLSGEVLAAPEEAELDARYDELQSALSDVERPTKMYFNWWLAILSAFAVGEGVAAPFLPNKAQQTSAWVGSGLSVIGIAALLLTPFPGRYAARELRGMPSSTLAEKRARVARGEELLEKDSDSAWFGTAWFQHVVMVLAGVGVGLGLGLAYPKEFWQAAFPSGLGTLLVAEAQVLTRPTRVMGHWDRYKKAHTPLQVSLTPVLSPNTLGLGVSTRF